MTCVLYWFYIRINSNYIVTRHGFYFEEGLRESFHKGYNISCCFTGHGNLCRWTFQHSLGYWKWFFVGKLTGFREIMFMVILKVMFSFFMVLFAE